MKASLGLAGVLLVGASWAGGAVSPSTQTRPAQTQPARTQPAKAPATRGFAVVREGRPAHFPHRIWAFSDFEARPADFGWFGAEETKNIPAYPGNHAARRGTGPEAGAATLKTGMNPVPGPRMGKVNKLYVRYYIEGTDEAIFQHFSLTSNDNCNIRASGLTQGRWSETVLDFTHDSRRNDGSDGAFKDGERMDDLQVYVGKPADGKDHEVIIDDAIFFAEDPRLPPEPEPFPRRVIFLAAFDTGIDPASRAKYWPGRLEIVSDSDAPRGSYWAVAKAVPDEAADALRVRLDMKPARRLGPNTKLRFRYWVKGAGEMRVTLAGPAGGINQSVRLTDPEQGEWATRYVTFSGNERASDGAKLPVDGEVDSLSFVVDAGPDVQLVVDEVVLYDAW